jgi:hypothetical protein
VFIDVCRLREKLEPTSSKSSMVALVSDFIKGLDVEDLELAVRFIIGELFPPWETEVGRGASGVVECVVKAFFSSKEEFFEAFKFMPRRLARDRGGGSSGCSKGSS